MAKNRILNYSKVAVTCSLEATLQISDSWSKLFKKSGPTYLLPDAEVSLRATEISCLQ